MTTEGNTRTFNIKRVDSADIEEFRRWTQKNSSRLPATRLKGTKGGRPDVTRTTFELIVQSMRDGTLDRVLFPEKNPRARNQLLVAKVQDEANRTALQEYLLAADKYGRERVTVDPHRRQILGPGDSLQATLYDWDRPRTERGLEPGKRRVATKRFRLPPTHPDAFVPSKTLRRIYGVTRPTVEFPVIVPNIASPGGGPYVPYTRHSEQLGKAIRDLCMEVLGPNDSSWQSWIDLLNRHVSDRLDFQRKSLLSERFPSDRLAELVSVARGHPYVPGARAVVQLRIVESQYADEMWGFSEGTWSVVQSVIQSVNPRILFPGNSTSLTARADNALDSAIASEVL